MGFEKILSKGINAEKADERLFRLWEADEIDTKRCLHDFLRNYKMSEEQFLEAYFRDWLNSLGYYNKETREKVPTGCYRV